MSEPGKQSTVEVNKRPIALMGEFPRNLDPKRRLTIPSVWRAALGPDFVYVLPDVQRGCLRLIPRDTMETRLAELAERALGDPELNEALEKIGSSSEMLEFDVQGRIRISDKLLAFAHLKGSVVLKGSIRMATIWPGEEKSSEQMGDLDELGAAMKKLNF